MSKFPAFKGKEQAMSFWTHGKEIIIFFEPINFDMIKMFMAEKIFEV